MPKEFDFAVIGGGLVGAATAYGLAQAGQRVAMLDEGDVAARASRGNFALVWVQNKGADMPPYARWTRRSAELWPAFASELREVAGVDVAYRRPGGFHLVLTRDELERRESALKRLHNRPDLGTADYEVLDGDEIRRRLPEAGPAVEGGTFCARDGHVNSLRLFHALHTGFAREGGTYLSDHVVDRLSPSEGGFVLDCAGRTIRAGKVVLAAGLGNRRLGRAVGLDVPVRPLRGQVIVTEKTTPFLDHPLSTIRQTDEGGVMIGDSQEEAGFSDQIGPGVLGVMAERAVHMFPRLGRLNAVRTWAALRVMSPDGFPIYHRSAEHPNAFVATCHSGVTLAAAHAKALAPALVDTAPFEELEPFSLRRFHVSKAA